MINTAFFGTSDKSTPILEDLKQNTNLVLCVTKTDRVVGRKKEVKETVVKTWAKQNSIEVFEIEKLTEETRKKLIEKLKTLKIDVGVVADFSFIIHEEILSTPKHGLINIHFSELPKYRGASPVQHTILSGEKTTAVTFMKMSKGMDEGDLLVQLPYSVSGLENTEQLYSQLFELAGKNTSKVLMKYINGEITPKHQDHDKATYCYSKTNPTSTLIDKMDAKIDWTQTSRQIERAIRAYNPWPIAWTTLEELDEAHLFANYALNPKKDKSLTVKIYDAKLDDKESLQPQVLQVEGGTKISLKEFLNGYFDKK